MLEKLKDNLILEILTVFFLAAVIWLSVPDLMKGGRIQYDVYLSMATILFCLFWVDWCLLRGRNKESGAHFLCKYQTEILFVAFCFFMYLAWSVIIPFNQAPDEEMRYLIPKFIYNHGYLPVGNESEIVNKVWGQSYAFQPILAYQVQALAMTAASVLGMAEGQLFYAARFVNVLISTGTVIIALQIGNQFFKGKNALFFAGLIALWPQFVFISVYVNNDALGFFSAMLIFYCWLLGRKKHWNLKTCILLGIGLSLCSLSYFNAYGFIFCSALLYAGDYFAHRREWSAKRFIGYGCMILAICALLAGWWFVRSALLHNGDVLGLTSSSQLAEQIAQPAFKPSQMKNPQNSGLSFIQMLYTPFNKQKGWIYAAAMSFVGVFGNASVAMDLKYYLLLAAELMVGMGAFLVMWFREKRQEMTASDAVWGVTLVMAILCPVCLCLYYSYTSDYQPQGRYFLSALIPAGYLIVLGYNWFEKKINIWVSEKGLLGGIRLPVEKSLVIMQALTIFAVLSNSLFAVYVK